MANIWQELPKPFLVLAPMEDVTDVVFRQIVAKCAKPDVFFTEFVSADGLCSNGRKRLLPKLALSDTDHPIIAQLWGLEPKNFYTVAQEVKAMGFDGIDINMGCPVRTVLQHGACSGLIKNPKLASEIIKATQEGAGGLPVSVKTRIGLSQIITEEWIGFLLTHHLHALTVHGRTAKEMSKVPCHWDEIGKAVQLRNKIDPETILIGNGDVTSPQDAMTKVQTYGVDGVMIGRGVFHDMYVFDKTGQVPRRDLDGMLELLLEHIELYEKTWDKTRPFVILRKYFKIYVSGFEGASHLRERLMETKTADQARAIIADFRNATKE